MRVALIIACMMTFVAACAVNPVTLEKEFMIMEFMLKHTEKPLTRKEIAEYVWQNQTDSTNIVDVYVNFLRKKIETVSDVKYIHTVRGIGYVFKEEDEKG